MHGPFERRTHPGVPADHFPPAHNRYRAVDHHGRVTALVAHGPTDTIDPAEVVRRRVAGQPFVQIASELGITQSEAAGIYRTELTKLDDPFGALAVHHTPTDDGAWDGPAAEANLSNDAGASTYKKAFAWVDPDKDADTKAAYRFIHHDISSDGTVGSANVKACSSGIGVLNGGRGGTTIPTADQKGVYNHLIAHLKDSGVKEDDLPELDTSHVDDEPFGHAAFTGSHSHQHSAMGTQGGDDTHDHKHAHDGDGAHSHSHAHGAICEALSTDGHSCTRLIHESGGMHSDGERTWADATITIELPGCGCGTPGCTCTDGMDPGAQCCSGSCAACMAANSDDATAARARLATLTASGLTEAGAELREQLVAVMKASAAEAGLVDYTALEALIADAGSDLPQIVTAPGGQWHAYLCVEGIRTDDGREIAMGATQFPDLPVTMRYTVKDEGGHYGAVTCGRIDSMAMQNIDVDGLPVTVCYAEGSFGSDEHGQLAQLAVEEQTQRFVSIDPRDVQGEYIEVAISTSSSIFDDVEPCYDGWFRMTSFVIGAATIVPIPALQQAVVTMIDTPLPMAPLATERAQPSISIAAAGAPIQWPDIPPAEWFSTPVPTVGDSRLVRQPDGKYAVPLTVTEDGRVYGHACYWGQEHTGFPGQKVRPPRSATYAHFMTGERVVQLEDGTDDRIPVGKLTMGCGHPSVTLPHAPAKAHYDGGYGAVQVADVRAVEDDFGIWLSGALCPAWDEVQNPDGPTMTQVQQFMSLDLSPDWRKISGKLHMLACLAVPVGGFPVAREAMVASGGLSDDDLDSIGVARANYEGTEIVAMVAAGRVHRMSDAERIHQLEAIVDELHGDLIARRKAEARSKLTALVEV